jgi:hypothetical protein
MMEATYVSAFGQNLPVSRHLNAVPAQYFSTSPVRDDATNNYLTQQVPNPFAGLLPGTEHQRRQRGAQPAAEAVPAVHGHQTQETIGASDYTSLQTRSSAAWPTESPCRWPTRWSQHGGERTPERSTTDSNA